MQRWESGQHVALKVTTSIPEDLEDRCKWSKVAEDDRLVAKKSSKYLYRP